MTKAVAIYVTDYGYGHASRIIAIIREIHEIDKRINIHIRTYGPANFMKRSCPYCRIYRSKNDAEIVCESNTYKINEKRTLQKAYLWFSKNKEKYLSKENKFHKRRKIDVILVDIPPYPFEVAKSVDVPSIAVSNFNWYWIYANFKHAHRMNFIEQLKEAYEKAQLALLLPLHDGMDIFKNKTEIPLVTRRIFEKPLDIRARLGVKENQKLIFLSVGRSLTYDAGILHNLKKWSHRVQARFILSSGASINENSIRKIPQDTVESQNYVAACDLVATKTGYSIVSECLANKVPMVLVNRKGFAEDETISKKLSSLGVAKTLGFERFKKLTWLDNLDKLVSQKTNYQRLPSIYKPQGARIAALKTIEFI